MSGTAQAGLAVPRAVLTWCFWYTRGLDADTAGNRRNEIASDLHEQRAELLEDGVAPWRISAHVAGRALRGAPADLLWRAERIRDDDTNRPALNRLRWSESITALGHLLTLAMVGTGVYVYARVAGALTRDDISYVPSATYALILLTLFGIAGMALLLARRTRRWGAALMVIPSVWLPTTVMHLLYVVSATGTAVFGFPRAGFWAIAMPALSIGLITAFATVFFTAAWTARQRRRTPRTRERPIS